VKIIRANDVMRKAGEMELEICQVEDWGANILLVLGLEYYGRTGVEYYGSTGRE
jgi:hypothetical protein